jgi:hypothetical protein
MGEREEPGATEADPPRVRGDLGHLPRADLPAHGDEHLLLRRTLEIFKVDASGGLTHESSVPVGLEPVAVAARSNDEAWVVNHLSDSVSVVAVKPDEARVQRTLLVGDEPRDIVFAGTNRGRAFITTAHRGQNVPFDPQFLTPGIGRADVWVFDADSPGGGLGGAPLTIVTLFGDTPRALAATPDGAKVYAAVFNSGNRTTTVHRHLMPSGPGPRPAPNVNHDGDPGRVVGLIQVRREQLARHDRPHLGRAGELQPPRQGRVRDRRARQPARAAHVRGVRGRRHDPATRPRPARGSICCARAPTPASASWWCTDGSTVIPRAGSMPEASSCPTWLIARRSPTPS